MTPTIKLDTSEFNRTFREYIKWNQRDLADIVNLKMLMILKRARQLTPHASRQEILRDTGAEDIYKTSKKTGVVKRSFGLIGGKANPYKLMNYWAKKKGKSIPAASRQQEARKFVGRRLSAVGSLKAGWNLALKAFAIVAKQAFDGDKKKVKNKGRATVAKPGWNPVAVVEYNLASKKGSEFQIDPRVEIALSRAFAEETNSMKDYITNKMQQRVDSMARM